MKAAKIITVVCAVLLLSGMAKAGLVAYYDFNNQADLKIDASGSSRNLTVSGEEGVYSTDSVYGGSLAINSTAQGYTATYTIYPSGSFSFVTWVKLDAASAMITLPNRLEAGFGVTAIASTNVLQFQLYRSEGTKAGYAYFNSIAVTFGSWYHVAATFDTDGTQDANGNFIGTWKCYVNGELLNTQTSALYHPTGFRGNPGGMHIGKRSALYFNGKYDDFAVFDAALTDVEVNSLANKLCTPVNAQGFVPGEVIDYTPIAYYNFDDPNGLPYGMKADISGNDKHLQVQSGCVEGDYSNDGVSGGCD